MANKTKAQMAGRILGGAVKKTVAANMKLWGGNNVPYLRDSVNAAMSMFDYEKLWDKLVEPSIRSKVKTGRKEIMKATNEIASLNHNLGTMKNNIATITSELYYLKITANAYAQQAGGGTAFGPSIIYRINESVLRKLNMHGAINITKYNNLNKNVVPQNVQNDYNNKIKSLKNVETKVIGELNRLSQAEQKLKRAQKQLDDIINSQNR